jgi:hypothetical protein
MPLIAYLRAHGSNDFPLHFALFGYLEQQGILDKFDFALEPMMDLDYCVKLMTRFPQLKLTEDVSRPRRWMRYVKERMGRAYRPFGFLDKFDAVCEAPGGRINEQYASQDIFRFYPRVKRRAILFHSIEAGALKNPAVRQSVATADLVISRSSQSARNACHVGAKWVVDSADIIFLEHPQKFGARPGIVVALRLPNVGVTEDYLNTLRDIIGRLERLDTQVEFVLVENPFGREMKNNGLGGYLKRNTGLYYDDTMYLPFLHRRDAIVSSRLHTTLISLLNGNRKILQFHIEGGTNKTEEILGDMGIHSIKINRQPDVGWPLIERFLNEEPNLPEDEVQAALDLMKSKTLQGMNAFCEWLDTIKG